MEMSFKERGHLKRPRPRWADNIKNDFKVTVRERVDWTELVLDKKQWRAFVNTVMNVSGFHETRGVS
jgi:hypothetical protein